MDYQELRFEFAPTSSCSVIQVQDVTPWPMTIHPFVPRNKIGLALFWTNGINHYADFSNPINGLWTINFPQNGIWTVYMFMIIGYDSKNTGDANDIRYYNGNFYLALQPYTVFTPPPPDPLYWQLLTVNDLDLFINYQELNANIPYGEFHLNWVVNCDENNEPEELADNGNIINSACHLFSVINPLPDNGRNVVVKVYPFDMSEVLQCGIIDVVAGSTSIDFTTPEDNVYVFQIGYQPAGTTDCEIDYEDLYLELPKYDFCDVQSCFFRLVQMLLCNELDPCCQNCDPAFIEQRKIYREELNKMLALMLTLYGFINVDQLNYLHFNQLYSYDMSSGEFTPLVPDRNMLIGKIQDVINKLRDIAGRCGDCNGPRENLTATQPCTNCGGSR